MQQQGGRSRCPMLRESVFTTVTSLTLSRKLGKGREFMLCACCGSFSFFQTAENGVVCPRAPTAVINAMKA